MLWEHSDITLTPRALHQIYLKYSSTTKAINNNNKTQKLRNHLRHLPQQIWPTLDAASADPPLILLLQRQCSMSGCERFGVFWHPAVCCLHWLLLILEIIQVFCAARADCAAEMGKEGVRICLPWWVRASGLGEGGRKRSNRLLFGSPQT